MITTDPSPLQFMGYIVVFAVIYTTPAVIVAAVVGRQYKMGFFWSLLVCLVTSPLFGYFIIGSSGLKEAKGCNWCGNTYNEAEYCGLCGKNEPGELRPGFVPKKH